MTVRTHTATAWLLGLALLASCAPSSPGADGRDDAACDDADRAVVAEVMATANTDFRTGDSIVKDFDLVEAATAPIPADRRQFGAERLMVLLVAVTIDDEQVSSDFQGAQGPVYVVLDGDGDPLGPLGTFSQPYFDLQPPDEPGWTAWADGIDDSDVAHDLFGCVNPS